MRSVSQLFGVQYSERVGKLKKQENYLPNQFVEPTKINLSELYKQVLEHPDRFQYEHAKTFGVSKSAISKAFNKLGISSKI